MYKEMSNQSSLDLKASKILTNVNINDSIDNFKIITNDSETIRESDSDTGNSIPINHLKMQFQQFGANNKRDRQFIESKREKRGEAKVTTPTAMKEMIERMKVLMSKVKNPSDTEQDRKEVNMFKGFLKQLEQSQTKRHSPEPTVSVNQPLKKVFRLTS